ncbi:MAG: hypothetical protein DHS80DRAFT_23091 [Piptocephalis tieghemiana]|nr:MAG: hypothetical protein DHS80DRAFT_23091 [Piptocephalis tieghemiana]
MQTHLLALFLITMAPSGGILAAPTPEPRHDTGLVDTDALVGNIMNDALGGSGRHAGGAFGHQVRKSQREFSRDFGDYYPRSQRYDYDSPPFFAPSWGMGRRRYRHRRYPYGGISGLGAGAFGAGTLGGYGLGGGFPQYGGSAAMGDSLFGYNGLGGAGIPSLGTGMGISPISGMGLGGPSLSSGLGGLDGIGSSRRHPSHRDYGNPVKDQLEDLADNMEDRYKGRGPHTTIYSSGPGTGGTKHTSTTKGNPGVSGMGNDVSISKVTSTVANSGNTVVSETHDGGIIGLAL